MLNMILALDKQCPRTNAPTTTTTTTVSTTTSSTLSTTTTPQKINYRLPTALKPYLYDITTKTAFDSLTQPTYFDGVVHIDMECLTATNTIILHQSDIKIDNSSINVTDLNNAAFTVNIVSTSYDNETEFYKITLSAQLTKGAKYRLSMNYRADLRTDNVGFYKSFYYDNDRNKRYV